MTRVQIALDALALSPKTNAELQDVLETHCGDISRMMANLMANGRVKRVDGSKGKGTVATYALVTK